MISQGGRSTHSSFQYRPCVYALLALNICYISQLYSNLRYENRMTEKSVLLNSAIFCQYPNETSGAVFLEKGRGSLKAGYDPVPADGHEDIKKPGSDSLPGYHGSYSVDQHPRCDL